MDNLFQLDPLGDGKSRIELLATLAISKQQTGNRS